MRSAGDHGMLRPTWLAMAGPQLRLAKAGSVASFYDTGPNRLNFIVRFTMAPSSYLLVTVVESASSQNFRSEQSHSEPD